MRTVFLLGAIALASLLACGRSPGQPTASTSRSPNEGVVTRIVDGDTIRVDILDTNERVRLIGIDAPEVAKEGQAGECFGGEATGRLAELIPVQSTVRLVRDNEARDAYGRLLAYVYRPGDDLFVNLRLVTEGFALPLSIRPNTAHADEFAAARRQAEAEGRGLWSACTAQTSSPSSPGTNPGGRSGATITATPFDNPPP